MYTIGELLFELAVLVIVVVVVGAAVAAAGVVKG